MTLTEFLLARIAEDANWAEMAGHGFGHHPISEPRNAGWTDIEVVENCRPSYDAGFIARNSPDRVLAECEAKRRIVELHSGFWCGWSQDSSYVHEPDDPCETLRALVLPYADHPDYDEAWNV